MASTAATNTGMCSGRHPAITPWTAIFQGVTRTHEGGNTATSFSGDRGVQARNSSIRSMVGGIIAKPSVHQLAKKKSFTSWSDPRKIISLLLAAFDGRSFFFDWARESIDDMVNRLFSKVFIDRRKRIKADRPRIFSMTQIKYTLSHSGPFYQRQKTCGRNCNRRDSQFLSLYSRPRRGQCAGSSSSITCDYSIAFLFLKLLFQFF